MRDDDHPDRARLAEQIVWLAWRDLPAYDRRLLESVGASQWQIIVQPAGGTVSDLLHSAGYARLDAQSVADLDQAVGVWISQLRLVLINAAHSALDELDGGTYEAMLARAAWHEWAHALAVVRATRDDVAAWPELLCFDGPRAWGRGRAISFNCRA